MPSLTLTEYLECLYIMSPSIRMCIFLPWTSHPFYNHTHTFFNFSSACLSHSFWQTRIQLTLAASRQLVGTLGSVKLTKIALCGRRARFKPIKFLLLKGCCLLKKRRKKKLVTCFIEVTSASQWYYIYDYQSCWLNRANNYTLQKGTSKRCEVYPVSNFWLLSGR